METEAVERLAIHVILHSKNKLELTLTPQSVKIFEGISNAFSETPFFPLFSIPNEGATVKNHLGPRSVVTLLVKVSFNIFINPSTRKIYF